MILYKFIYYSTYFKLEKYTKNLNLDDSKNKRKKSKKILNNLYVLDNIYFLGKYTDRYYHSNILCLITINIKDSLISMLITRHFVLYVLMLVSNDSVYIFITYILVLTLLFNKCLNPIVSTYSV